MPFTPAHVAAVLPLTGRRRPRWVVPAALVIGSMVPDVLYFVPIRSDRTVSHSLTGLVTLDLALGLVFLALWRWVAAPAVRDLAPAPLRRRLPVPPRVTWREALWSVPGVLLGGLTHLVWDSFTHTDGWAVQRIPLLSSDPGVPVFKLAQYASGVLGCAVVLAYCLTVQPRADGAREGSPSSTRRERQLVRAVLVGAPVLVGLVFAVAVWLQGTEPEMLLYVAVVRGVSGLGLAAAGVAAWWHLAVRGRPAREAVAASASPGV